MAQCTAVAKSTKHQCRRRAVTGYQVCQVHGAGSPLQGRPGGYHRNKETGVIEYGGKYSKMLPTKLRLRYELASTDPDLLSLREEIALIDARIQDLIEKLPSNESGYWWRMAQSAMGDLEDAMRRQDTTATADSLRELKQSIAVGTKDWATWGEITDLIERRRKVVESERDRLTKMKQIITTEEAYSLINAMAQAVNEHVTDDISRSRIITEFIRLTEKSGGRAGQDIIFEE